MTECNQTQQVDLAKQPELEPTRPKLTGYAFITVLVQVATGLTPLTQIVFGSDEGEFG